MKLFNDCWSSSIRFFLYLRLFIVMGVTWIVEIVSYAFPKSVILHAFDLLNCLQGIIIFILFVCKPNVKKMIVQRYKFRKLRRREIIAKFILRFDPTKKFNRQTISSKHDSANTIVSTTYSSHTSNISTSRMVSFSQ